MCKIILLLSCVGIIVYHNQVNALKCWRCSNYSKSQDYCDDFFDTIPITENQKRWVYVHCILPENLKDPTKRPVCKKYKQMNNDVLVTTRSCAFEDINASEDLCIDPPQRSYITNVSCEKCYYDGCNGVDMNPQKPSSGSDIKEHVDS